MKRPDSKGYKLYNSTMYYDILKKILYYRNGKQINGCQEWGGGLSTKNF